MAEPSSCLPCTCWNKRVMVDAKARFRALLSALQERALDVLTTMFHARPTGRTFSHVGRPWAEDQESGELEAASLAAIAAGKG